LTRATAIKVDRETRVREARDREGEGERDRQAGESESASDALPNRIHDMPQKGQDSDKRGDEAGAKVKVHQINLHNYKTAYQTDSLNPDTPQT